MKNGSWTRLAALTLGLLGGVFVAVGCAGGGTDNDAGSEAAVAESSVTYDDHGDPVGLHRYHKWSERLTQGAQPKGEEAFRNLAALGYTTVLTVDGAIPDVENAEKYGLRYVHVPIGYDGVPRDAAARIVAAVERSEGPVYVHCHHGKHRGPAAMVTARMFLDGISPEQAVEEIRESGCSPKYEGLYRDTANFELTREEVDAVTEEDLPSVVLPDGLLDAMVHVSHRWEGVQLVREAGWGVPPSSPDIAPAHEATMLWEYLRESGRLPEAKEYGKRYIEMTTVSEQAAYKLAEAIRAENFEAAERHYQALKVSCNTCHTAYRN